MRNLRLMRNLQTLMRNLRVPIAQSARSLMRNLQTLMRNLQPF
jgi:hypothetical protein